jgi:MATE family multidrug resistance protein
MVTLAVDLIMVGDLGTVPLAAVTLAGTSSTMVLLFGVGFTIAMTPEIATRMARGDASGASAAARAGAIMSILVAAVLVGLLLLASPWLGILGAPADVTEMAIPYFRWYVLSFLFRLGFGAIKQTSEALGNSRMPMMIAIAANLLNVVFNWIFIYGELGMPEMGAEGAGFATFLSRVCAVGIGVWVLRRSSLFAPLRGHAQQTLSGKERMSLALAGASIGLQITLEVAAFAFGGLMVG